MDNKKVEIFIQGRKLCEVSQDNEAIEFLERIVRKAGYTVVNEIEENGNIIKMI